MFVSLFIPNLYFLPSSRFIFEKTKPTSSKLIDSNFRDPLNIGSSEDVTINEMADILEDISGIKPKRSYKLDAPRGVFNRNSDNTLIKKTLNWEPTIKLVDGLKTTFDWIFKEYQKKNKA